jgi:hypothetical protein
MTRLAARKTKAQFEADTVVRGRTLIIEATPYTAVLREKGRRQRYEVSWEAIYWLAAKIAADNKRRERKAHRRVA